MDILIIGGGGREHALAWKLRQSPRVGRLVVAPGNGGIARMKGVETASLDVADVAGLRDFAQNEQIDLTIVGPEAPLAAGLVDVFQEAGLRVFGPTRRAAQLESSKAFAKEFMRRHAIPTAQAAAFTEYAPALDYLQGLHALPVIKASGLAGGKGVIVPQTLAEAEQALRALLVDRQFGAAGETVLIEERLVGPEISVLAFCDGRSASLMPAAQDHKRVFDHDQGPNTGGMGAFAPSPLFTPDLRADVEERVFSPTLEGMAREGSPFTGVLYAGLMLTDDGPRVLEFNCRFGDPETQVILPLLRSDLVEIIEACLEGRLQGVKVKWAAKAAVTVVMAAQGYPGPIEVGDPVQGLRKARSSGCLVFHGGTERGGRSIVSAGGRVVAVTGVAKTLAEATRRAYAGVNCIHFRGAHFRTDIAQKAAATQT